ncbi:MAG TPA: hypothetical protein VFU88_07720 [Ktedonobacterales bacterium]|nr:hypothetical protein [Ktedonobacterales bacterium]
MGGFDPVVTYFEQLPDGYLVAFGGDPAAIRAARRVVLGLDHWQRAWVVEEAAWWISDEAIRLLGRRLPVVAEALDRWHARTETLDDLLRRHARWERWEQRRPHRFVPNSSSASAGPGVLPPAVAAAYRALDLAPGASVDEVRAARRRLARRHHPDTGGEHARMAAVNAAADTIFAWLAEQAPLPATV